MHKILIYLYIIHLLKSSTCFEHYPAYPQEVYVVIVYMQPLVSSLSAGDCLVHRLRKKRSLINVLYVNKQEFCSSSCRSNQGYTTMHGKPIIKNNYWVVLYYIICTLMYYLTRKRGCVTWQSGTLFIHLHLRIYLWRN